MKRSTNSVRATPGQSDLEQAALVFGKGSYHVIDVPWELPNDAIACAARLAVLKGCSLGQAVALALDEDREVFNHWYEAAQKMINEFESAQSTQSAERGQA